MLRDTIPGQIVTPPSTQFKQDPVTGMLLYYDDLRHRYISTDRKTVSFSIDHSNINHPLWMKVIGVLSNNNGYPILRHAIITNITVSTSSKTDNCVFRLKNDVGGPDISTITLFNQSFHSHEGLDIPINSGKSLRVYADVITNHIDHPIITIELAWR